MFLYGEVLGRIAVICRYRRPVVTDGVAWSVGLSVTIASPAKTAEPFEILFGLRTRTNETGSKSSVRRGNFDGGRKRRPMV